MSEPANTRLKPFIARIAASNDPGDRNVSASSCAQPSSGTAALTRAR